VKNWGNAGKSVAFVPHGIITQPALQIALINDENEKQRICIAKHQRQTKKKALFTQKLTVYT
jgi:hypothetical protein